MSLLTRRDLNPAFRSHREDIEAGGRWVAFGRPDPTELVAEIRSRGIRSFETFQSDLSFLRELPQLEFLAVSSDPRDVRPIHDLPNLRRLSFSGTYDGRLDFARLPKLEHFSVNEGPRDGRGLDSLFGGHPRLESLSIGRSRLENLASLGRLRLRTLGLSGGLTSLGGSAALGPTLRRLALDGTPNLPSMDGVEMLTDLEVVSIQGLRHVTTVEWAAELRQLRLLSLFDQKGIESLRPLADHPSLEFLTFGRVKDLDLEPLARIPRLKLFLTGHYRWNRDLADFPYLHGLPRDDPARREYYSLISD